MATKDVFVNQEAIASAVKDKTQNHEEKKMADEAEAKMKNEIKKTSNVTAISFRVCSSIILVALVLILISLSFLNIANSDDSLLELNQPVLLTCAISSGVAILLSLCFLSAQIKIHCNLEMKWAKTTLLLNLIRNANQAEAGVLRSAMEELNEEFRRKQRRIELARNIIGLVMGCFVIWMGGCVDIMEVADFLFHHNDVVFRILWTAAPAFFIFMLMIFLASLDINQVYVPPG